MEQLMAEIEAYAAARGWMPTTVVQRSTPLGGSAWAKWKAGASCTMATAERIRAYMAANPPVMTTEPDVGLPTSETHQRGAA